MQLGTQISSAVLLIVLMTLVHGVGLVGMMKLLNLEDEALKARRLGLSSFALMVTMAMCLFTLHAAEIALFALFYLAVGAVPAVEEALFVSASAYSTLGLGIDNFPLEWRLVAAMEGVTGFILLGWSTAFFVTDMNKLLRK